MCKSGMIVLGHGSRRKEVAAVFEAMVGRVAVRVAEQMPGVNVLPAFFSLGEPTLADQVRVLVSDGCERITIMQYFLYNGVHIDTDIPAMVADLRQEYPAVEFVVQPTLQDDPAMERLIVERLVGERLRGA